MEEKGIFRFALLWLPPILLGVLLAVETSAPRSLKESVVSENGFLEILQFIILVLACGAALYYLFKTSSGVWRLIPALFITFFVGSFYIAGEEISWGQHFWGWETPETWQLVNDQQETNLHNTTSWLDQKPRLLLEIGVIVGGLILPFLTARRPSIVPGWLQEITPSVSFAVIAACFTVVKLADKVGDIWGINVFGRPAEITETYIYYFILLYIIYLGYKFGAPKKISGEL